MKTTFIVKNLTEDTLAAIAAMAPRDAFEKLQKWAFGDLKHCVSVKFGTGQFRDRVEWNSFWKSGGAVCFTIEPRKGYKLIVFVPA